MFPSRQPARLSPTPYKPVASRPIIERHKKAVLNLDLTAAARIPRLQFIKLVVITQTDLSSHRVDLFGARGKKTFVPERRRHVISDKIEIARRRNQESRIRHQRICENKRPDACTVAAVTKARLQLESLREQFLFHGEVELDQTIRDGDWDIDLGSPVDG